jgi:glyoxylate reductase
VQKPSIFIARPIQQGVIDLVAGECQVTVHPRDEALPAAEMSRCLADMDGVISVGGNISAEIVASAPRLKIVANIGAGYDSIDVSACTKRGIGVTNTPDVLTESTADFTFALLLAVTRRVLEADQYVRDDKWKAGLFDLLWGTELHGKTLGLYGFGSIGKAVARRARGFSMRILYHSRKRASLKDEQELGAEYVDLDTLLRSSDFVSLHAPLNDESRQAIDASKLAMMKPEAFLINTARGKIVNEADLVEFLRRRKIAGAGLDVFENEPQIHASLTTLGNVVLAPHIASATSETRHRMASLAATNLLTFFEGKRPPNILNPEVLHLAKA